jgi:hypothetical protein
MIFSSLNTIAKMPKKTVPVIVDPSWVAVGESVGIVSSSNGKTWTATTPQLTSLAYYVAYGKDSSDNGLWVAIAGGATILNSSNGKVWNVAADKAGLGMVFQAGVAYGKDGPGENALGRWIAVGAGTPKIVYSSDGNYWHAAANVAGLTSVHQAAYGTDSSGNRRWVATGDTAVFAYSEDGSNWTASETKGGISQGWSIAYGKDASGAGLWVAGGGGAKIAYSPNGNKWYPAANTGGITNLNSGPWAYGVAYGKDGNGNGRWVAVGGGAKIVHSPDGSNWTQAGNINITMTHGRGVAYGKDDNGNGLWVVGTYTGQILGHSPDGNTWTASSNVGGLSSNGMAMAYKRILYEGVDNF